MRPEATPVTTVVVTRDRRDQLMHSLARHRPPVILVDNGSTDGTVAAVRAAFPEVDVVPLPSNRGSTARNVGVARASTPYVAFADDDSWWDTETLHTCAALMDAHPRLALAAARLLVGEEERLDPICRLMTRSPLPRRIDVPGRPVLGFLACQAVVRREAFLQAGGFDEVVFFAGEEDRLAWDLAAAGWELSYLPQVVAHHHPQSRDDGASRTARQRLITRNALLTATMRRPWTVVATEVARAAGSGMPGLGGVTDAIPRLPAALRRRAHLPVEVEARLRPLQIGS